jgi:single-stranded-DNA-specific exonuclease
MRVDAAFYLQINEFRGVRSVQLQMIDLRPAVGPSGREQECLDLVDRLVTGADLTAGEADRLLLGREQFVALWRAIERLEREQQESTPRLPALRRLAGSLSGSESFLRAAVGVEIFAERGLVSLHTEGETMSLHPLAGHKADLEQSAYMVRLRRTLRDETKGGAAYGHG